MHVHEGMLADLQDYFQILPIDALNNLKWRGERYQNCIVSPPEETSLIHVDLAKACLLSHSLVETNKQANNIVLISQLCQSIINTCLSIIFCLVPTVSLKDMGLFAFTTLNNFKNLTSLASSRSPLKVEQLNWVQSYAHLFFNDGWHFK